MVVFNFPQELVREERETSAAGAGARHAKLEALFIAHYRAEGKIEFLQNFCVQVGLTFEHGCGRVSGFRRQAIGRVANLLDVHEASRNDPGGVMPSGASGLLLRLSLRQDFVNKAFHLFGI